MIRIVENQPLIEELTVLLREEQSASPSDRAVLFPRIESLQGSIARNLRTRLHALGQDVTVYDRSVSDGDVPSFSKTYEALKLMYRESLSLAKQCSDLKKLMRERKKSLIVSGDDS